MKPVRAIVVILVVAVAALAILVRVRSPEARTLDAAARQGVAGRFITLGDGVTHYDVAGPDSGGRVMLVHGFSVPYYIWDSTAQALSAAGFRVARYDTYGRGYSDRPERPYTFDLFDRQLQQLLDSLDWRDSVNLIGLSFGGPVVANFTGRHPERVRTLTLIDPAAGTDRGLPWFFGIPIIGPALWQVLAVPNMAAGQFSDFYEPKRWPGWADLYRPQTTFRGFGRALLSTRLANADVSLDSIYARAGATGLPTLLFWGKEDHTVPFERSDGVRKAIPQVQFVPVDKAGHLPHMERTDVTNPRLVEFLRAGGKPTDSAAINR